MDNYDYDLFLSDEEIHVLEEDSEVVELRNEIDKLKEKLEDKIQIIKELEEKIEHDIKVNKRCLEEKTNVELGILLNDWLKYDNKLLEIINEE